MSQVAVAPADSVSIVRNGSKLRAAEKNQSITRMSCEVCGVHVFGKVADPDHHFYGLTFVHPELSVHDANLPIEFAGFLSSLIEQGMQPSLAHAVREELKTMGIATYDTFSPEIMDLIAWHKIKIHPQRIPEDKEVS
jgi:hypothetical protein